MSVPHNIRLAIAGLLLLAMATPAASEGPNCAGISDIQDRMACQAKKRRSYGEDLERRLAESVSEVRVFVEETGDPGSGAYPRLIVWTHLANEKPRQLNSEASILEGARSVGFRTLVYVDKGESNNWYFNLTRAGRVALDVVPWQAPPWKR